MNTVAAYIEELIKGSWSAGDSNCAHPDPEKAYERIVELLKEQGWNTPTDEPIVGVFPASDPLD